MEIKFNEFRIHPIFENESEVEEDAGKQEKVEADSEMAEKCDIYKGLMGPIYIYFFCSS